VSGKIVPLKFCRTVPTSVALSNAPRTHVGACTKWLCWHRGGVRKLLTLNCLTIKWQHSIATKSKLYWTKTKLCRPFGFCKSASVVVQRK